MSTTSANPVSVTPAPTRAPQPWWRFGHVWLIIAGPALVIVAGVFTAYLAVARPDPVVSSDYYQQGLELSKPHANPSTLAPAMQARNHAATGAVPDARRAAAP